MSTHRMSRHAHPLLIQHILILSVLTVQQLRQLLRHIALHLIILLVSIRSGIYIEPRAGSKIPALVFACNVGPTWGRVWVHDRDPVSRGRMLEEAFFGTVVRRAGQAGEVEEDWKLLGGGS